MSKVKNDFTKPVVSSSKGDGFFVLFYYCNPVTGKMMQFKRTGGLNRLKDPIEKKAEFEALREAHEQWLNDGWNPIDDSWPELPISQLQIDIEKSQSMTFVEALDYAFTKKQSRGDWSHRSIQAYEGAIKFIKEAAMRLNVANVKITDLRKAHYRTILDNVKEKRHLSSAGYNKYRDYLSSLIGCLAEYDVLEYNPIEKIKSERSIKIIAHREPTRDQRLTIISRIKQVDYNYYRFLAVLYGCSIRPKEICGLKIKNLHRLEQVFRLIPDDQGSTKTKFEREVVIPNWLMDLLSELNLHTMDPEWYIFSTLNNVKERNQFLPGPTRMHSNIPTKWWRKIVKEPVKKGGLGINVDQYSLKKLSGNDMVRLQRREGVDKLLELPKSQMGHQDTKTTEIYVHEHLEVMKELIRDKMPEL